MTHQKIYFVKELPTHFLPLNSDETNTKIAASLKLQTKMTFQNKNTIKMSEMTKLIYPAILVSRYDFTLLN